MLFSSHALPEVEQLAERVVIVNRGRLARTGQLTELTAGHGGLERVFLSLTAAGDVPGQGGGR